MQVNWQLFSQKNESFSPLRVAALYWVIGYWFCFFAADMKEIEKIV